MQIFLKSKLRARANSLWLLLAFQYTRNEIYNCFQGWHVHIFSFLSLKDHVSLAKTCRVCRSVSRLPTSAPRSVYLQNMHFQAALLATTSLEVAQCLGAVNERRELKMIASMTTLRSLKLRILAISLTDKFTSGRYTTICSATIFPHQNLKKPNDI